MQVAQPSLLQGEPLACSSPCAKHNLEAASLGSILISGRWMLQSLEPHRGVVGKDCIPHTAHVLPCAAQRGSRHRAPQPLFLCPQDPVLRALLAADLEGFRHFPSWEEAGEAAVRHSWLLASRSLQGAGGLRLCPGLTLLCFSPFLTQRDVAKWSWGAAEQPALTAPVRARCCPRGSSSEAERWCGPRSVPQEPLLVAPEAAHPVSARAGSAWGRDAGTEEQPDGSPLPPG